MRNICKTCKCEKRMARVKYYLGVKDVWQCKCGNRLVALSEPHWANYPQEKEEEE